MREEMPSDVVAAPTSRASLMRFDPTEIARLLEQLPAGAYTCDADGLITGYNRHAVDLWGRAPLLNNPIDRFCGSFKLHSADGKAIPHEECWMALALRTGREYNGHEVVVERPDGQRVTALAHANPIRDDAGRLLGALNVLIDITSRKEADRDQARLVAIIESSDDAIIAETLDGVILSWNNGAQRLFGHTSEDALGQSIALITPPEFRSEQQSLLARIRGGERIKDHETIRLSRDGRLISVSISCSPLVDRDGHIVGVSKVARDITERKRAERALVSLNEELAAQLVDLRRLHELSSKLTTGVELGPILEETLRTALAIEDSDMGVLLLASPRADYITVAASQGFDPDFFAVKSRVLPGEGVSGACFEQRRSIVIEDVATDPIVSKYRETLLKIGSRAIHGTPLITQTGKVIGVLTVHFRERRRPTERVMHLIDLCARQAADAIENAHLYAEIRLADQRKNEFLAILAHELRNPLAPIRNALELLRLDGKTAITFDETRDMMERQVDQMVRLVDDLMDASRITMNRLILRKEPLELDQVIRHAVESARPLIDANGHELTVELPLQPVRLEGDLARLAQVFSNLLTNAAKYTPAGGRIRLSAVLNGEFVSVSVEDNGLGIPPEMMSNVFQMFTQVDRSLERSQSGLGIGLSLVKGLVDLHNGTVTASSAGEGKGSTFTVRLPTQTAAAPGAKPAPASANGDKAESLRILVVDDHRDGAASLAMVLELMGHEVAVAHDGVEAVEMAESFAPAVIFLDIGLPRLNGYDAARRIREAPWGKFIYLIALTGWGQEADKLRSAEAGFDVHAVKPLDPAMLGGLIARTEPKTS